jgi:hypothetical protein
MTIPEIQVAGYGTAEIVVAAVAVLAVLAWVSLYAMKGDAGEATGTYLSSIFGVVLGFAAVVVAVITEVTSLVGEAPGFFSSVVISIIGWASLDNLIEVGPELFIFVAGAVVLGALITREA